MSKPDIEGAPSREKVATAAACVTVASSFLYMYWAVIKSLVGQWTVSPMYSYGFFIPFIALYLVYEQRDRLSKVSVSARYGLGAAFLVPAMALFLIGYAGSILILQELTLPVSIMGTVALLWGSQVLVVMLLPLTYLFFMIPFWEVFTGPFHHSLQLFSAWMGVKLLALMEVPVYLDGVFIYLPNVTLEIAEVCSGVNYLIAILAVGVPLALIHLKGWRRRGLLLLSAIFIAIISNGIRVSLIGLWSYRDSAADIHGPFHILQGLFVSLVGYLFLFLGLWALTRNQEPSARPGVVVAGSGIHAK